MHLLSDFESGLAALIGRPSTLRPFVCDGSPLACRAFIVGTNAASEVGNFWTNWSSAHGFDKAAFDARYRHERVQQGKPLVSPTRQFIERVVTAAVGISCLETNLYSKPSSRAAQLMTHDTSVFKYLIEQIQPEYFVAYRAGAERHLLKMGVSPERIITVRYGIRLSLDEGSRAGAELASRLGIRP